MKNLVFIIIGIIIGFLFSTTFVETTSTIPISTRTQLDELEKFAKNITVKSGMKHDLETEQPAYQVEIVNDEALHLSNEPKLNSNIDVYSEIVVQGFSDKFESLEDLEETTKEKVINLIKSEFTSEHLASERMAALINEDNIYQELILIDEAYLSKEQLEQKKQLLEQIESIMQEKISAREEFDLHLRDVLSQEDYSKMIAEGQKVVDTAARNYSKKIEDSVVTYVTDLNQYQKEQMSAIYQKYNNISIDDVSIGSLVTTSGEYLMNDDPASLRFMVSLQEEMYAVLSEQQFHFFLSGLQSEAKEYKNGLPNN